MGSGSACDSSGLGYSNRRARARRALSRLGSGLTPAGHRGTAKEISQLQDIFATRATRLHIASAYYASDPCHPVPIPTATWVLFLAHGLVCSRTVF